MISGPRKFLLRASAAAAIIVLASCSAGTAAQPGSSAAAAAPSAGSSTGSAASAASTAPGPASTSQPPGSSSTGQGAASTESNPAGDIPDTQAFVDYTPSAGGFTVQVPEGWARSQGGDAVTFTDKYNSITVTSSSAATAPTEQSAQAELTALAGGSTGFVAGTVSTLQRPAGPTVLITYQADSPVNPVTGKVVTQDIERYKYFSAGRVVTLTLAAPVGSDNVDPWRTVTDSFRWAA